MKGGSEPRPAVFDTFKTMGKGGGLTGEANRQRSIVAILANSANPVERTRTGISKQIGKKQGAGWRNVYSGVFRDLDEVLLPAGIVSEEGRLPLKRGPKALQEKGIPFYRLTRGGILIAVSLGEVRDRKGLLAEFFADAEPSEKEFGRILSVLAEASPTFAYSILERYTRAFCDGRIAELLPLDLEKLRGVEDGTLGAQTEVLRAFMGMSKQERHDVLSFLDGIS